MTPTIREANTAEKRSIFPFGRTQRRVKSASGVGTSYARNLSRAARTDGIQPGESIRLLVPEDGGGWQYISLGSAPTEPGQYVVEYDGTNTKFTVDAYSDSTTTQIDGADADQAVGDASGNTDGTSNPAPGFYETSSGERRVTQEATDTTADSNTTTSQAWERRLGIGETSPLSGVSLGGAASVVVLGLLGLLAFGLGGDS